jgi:hypothetical protein
VRDDGNDDYYNNYNNEDDKNNLIMTRMMITMMMKMRITITPILSSPTSNKLSIDCGLVSSPLQISECHA